MKIPAIDTIRSEAEARDYAIEWQQWISKNAISWKELINWETYFEALGKKFNLTDEFKENGII